MHVAYSGIYKVKKPEKYEGDSTDVVYRSMWEKWAFKWCDKNDDIVKWSSEEVVIPYYYEADKRHHRYFMDLKLVFKSGRTLLVEIKPDVQTRKPKKPAKITKRYVNEGYTFIKNSNKWEEAARFAKKRGWDFEIWTEKTLTKMGIMPKSVKPLKPFKRRAK